MNDELIELALKRIADLEKKVEKYFSYLEVNNELDFVLRGGYILPDDLDELIQGSSNNQTEEEENE